MSSRYSPVRTNRTPWMDDIILIKREETLDAGNYAAETTETRKEICCTFAEGINRAEFYESMKTGIRLSAAAEIWADDYEGQDLCEFEGIRYKIIRAYATGRGTMELSLSEVER